MTSARPPTIVLIGGGFTGAAIAWHFDRLLDGGAARLIIVEPRERLGAGVAYSADDPAFRINVPASKMSIDPDDGEDFARWLAATDALAGDPGAVMADGRSFPQRSVFGAYVGERIAPLLADGRLEHVLARATAIGRSDAGYLVDLDDGQELSADLVVLAVTHPPPEPPAILRSGLAGHPRFVTDTTLSGALDGIRPDDRVLVVGTGLTGADIIASLDRRGHRGPITAIARRGLRSKGHPPFPVEPPGDFASVPETTARGLLRAIRAEVAAATAAGLSWHGVLDTVRTQGHAIWAALPPAERRRLVRHLRPYWDVHRFRIAPQVEAALDRRIADGRLTLLAASVQAASHDGETIVVTLRRRRGGVETAAFDAVLVATGPAHGGILQSLPLASSLAEQGLIQADPSGLGILTHHSGHAIDQAGKPVDTLLIGGPLARGTFGELMGLPEVSRYARFIALELAKRSSNTAN
ncbi:MAG TPA: FAD/NAD(P)-binding protein [Kaistia sp.]|nr:FAD/NAD(P)-binding protein [Kaistia sp.]